MLSAQKRAGTDLAYHESPVDFPYERNLPGIRLRHTACVVYVPTSDGLVALQVGFLVVVPRILLALDDCILGFSRHAPLFLLNTEQRSVSWILRRFVEKRTAGRWAQQCLYNEYVQS
jgi:hypothetical protein